MTATTAAADWSSGEAATNPQPETSHGAQSSDLFDGELFGDELIDIYNAAVGEGSAAEGQPAAPGETQNLIV